MSDPFLELGIERRPLVDPALLRSAFFEASRRFHPDRPGGDAEIFLSKQRAYEILRDPAARLSALAALTPSPASRTSKPTAVPAEIFSQVAAAAAAAREVFREEAGPPLLAALRAAKRREAAERLEAASAALEAAEAEAAAALEALDARWPEASRSEIEALAARFRFLAKSRREVEEWRLKFRQQPANSPIHA
ncbi:MAG: J domain-containing protein [Terrimicrobiaceae bacterium]|nr:J domain-containing protein [Terrimicrobiaceae bacterium]